MTLPAPLAALGNYRQFILWQLQPNPGKKKPKKVSVDWRTLRNHDAHDPSVWLDVATAMQKAQAAGPTYGVGFVLTDKDPFFFVDLDEHLQPDGTWSATAQQVCSWFPGAAIEISHSGNGLHIIGTGTPPPHDCKASVPGVELYHTERFIALTGLQAVGDVATRHDAALAHMVQHVPGLQPTTPATPGAYLAPRADWRGPEDDTELLRRALQSTSAGSAFGGKASFADLWDADSTALARTYPSNSSDPWDASAADAALAQHLAFWTGCDAPRIERLMRQSKLARAKWDERPEYLTEMTIPKACSMQGEVLHDPEPVLPSAGLVPLDNATGMPTPQRTSGLQFASVDDQVALFTGCVYVLDRHSVMIPGGVLLKSEQFKAWYGGYVYNLDTANTRVTRDAFEALTQSAALRCPKVQTTVFRPQAPAGAILTLPDGTLAVNTWFPVPVPRCTGDHSPFLQHMELLLPSAADREILLAYLAACVQHQGIKFQWAPLIQGVEGNGKTILSKCVAEAVGQRYVHWPTASKLTAQFNSWMVGKTLYCVEDIYTPKMREEIFEELKPMITGENLEIEAKRVDQVTTEVCGNFILNTNHKAGLRKTRNDRRIAPFFCAQQTESDLQSQGFLGGYLVNLYDWLRGRNRYAGHPPGFSIVADFLWTYPIPPHLNPAHGFRAPHTSSTEEAIEVSQGAIEQHVQDAIEQGEQGFCGGWVSSLALGRLLERIKRPIPPGARRKLMADMGYDWHPALPEGRVNDTVMPDGGKPKLFIKRGHPLLALTSIADVQRHYTAAQAPALPPPPTQ